MKLFIYSFTFLASILFLASCGSTRELTQQDLNSRWELKRINGQDATNMFAGKNPDLNFNFGTNQIWGNNSCNTYNGLFSLQNNKFKSTMLTTTDASCADVPAQVQYMDLLSRDSNLKLINNELIFNQNGTEALAFGKSVTMTSDQASGTWMLETMNGQNAENLFSQNRPTIRFDYSGNKITGNAGCNDFTSTFSLARGVMEIGPFITTRMTCNDYDNETTFINTLPGRIEAYVVNNRLILRKDGNDIMTFRR